MHRATQAWSNLGTSGIGELVTLNYETKFFFGINENL
jgi:hypothetical protein